MASVGLVLSAGGDVGDPWHSGVLAALQDHARWDARTAELIVGTSAGAISATGIRAGLAPTDRYAAFVGDTVSAEGQAILDRLVTPFTVSDSDRSWMPMSPQMTARAIWPPWNFQVERAVVGLMPSGTKDAASLAARMREMHPEPWPSTPTWIVAIRLEDGRRIVFGRDDVRAGIGEAVRASAAVPGLYKPVKVGRSEYVDGGVHSTTNADLVAALGFEVVVISSSMTSSDDGDNLLSKEPLRARFGAKLAAEIATVQAAGSAVFMVEPSHRDLAARKAASSKPRQLRTLVSRQGYATAKARLAEADGDGLRAMLARASASGNA